MTRPAKRPPPCGNVPITVSKSAPITIRVGGVVITITQEHDHEKVQVGSKIQV